MIRKALGWIDLVLFAALVGAGVWVIACEPWSLESESAASLAGALFGAAAVLLGNWISRFNDRHKAEVELERKRTALKTMIAAELVNVAAGLLGSKKLMDAAIIQINAGGNAPGQIDMRDYYPRATPFIDGLGTEILLLEEKAIDALTMLRASLAQTRRMMESDARFARNTSGLSLTISTRLSQGLGHDMTILAEAFEHIAPKRKLKMSDNQDAKLVVEILKAAAPPPEQLPPPAAA